MFIVESAHGRVTGAFLLGNTQAICLVYRQPETAPKVLAK
jgi:hypothetical protein